MVPFWELGATTFRTDQNTWNVLRLFCAGTRDMTLAAGIQQSAMSAQPPALGRNNKGKL